MTEIALHILERRKDWPVIVTAVKCPVCNAAPLEQCQQLGLREYRSFSNRTPRSDFHQQRKLVAAKAFNIKSGAEELES